MRKTLAILLATLLGVMSLAGCGNNSTKTNEDASPSAPAATTGEDASTTEGGTLRIMMSSGDTGAGTIKPALDTAAELMGIKLEYDVIPDDQMLNVANTQLATGNSDDIILHNFGLTDVSSKDLAVLEGDWTSKITSTTDPLCKDENGDIKKAPLGGESNMGLLYNKEVLAAAGVSVPLNTYDEFIEACKKVKEAGYTPVYISNKEVWTAQILLLTSMTPVFVNNEDLVKQIATNKVKPKDVPELVTLFDNVNSLKELGYINDDYMSATNDMAFEALANGECAFYAQMDSAYSTLASSYPDKVDNIGMCYTPMWNDEKNGFVLFDSATNYLSVAAKSKNVELAKKFVNTVISRDVLPVYYNSNPGSVPYDNLGYELSSNPFNQEMRQYTETLPRYGTFNNNSYNGEATLESFYGAFNEQIQGMFSGYSVTETMDAWYDAYAADAQARQVDGF